MSLLCNNTNGANSPYYARTSISGSPNLQGSHTITARIRFTSTSTSADRWAAIWSAAANISGSYIGRWGGDPAGSWDCLRAQSSFPFAVNAADTAGYADTTTWRHFALTYDGSNIRAYIDGVLQDTQASSASLVSNTTNTNIVIGIGQMVMADVSLWNRALSAGELLTLTAQRNVEPVSNGSDLIAWYPLLEADFTQDYSGNGNHLSLVSGTGTAPVADDEEPPVPWEPTLEFGGTVTSPTASAGTLRVRKSASGSSASPSASTGTLRVRKLFAGATASPTAATGTLRARKTFAGSATSPTAATASTAVRNLFSGSSASPSAAAGTLQVRKLFGGASTSPSACTGTADVQTRFSGGVSTSPSGCVGTLQARVVFSGSCQSSTACTGVLQMQGTATFNGAVTSPSGSTGTLRVRKSSSAAASSMSASTATLRVLKPTAAAVSSPSASTGTLRVLKYFAGVSTSPTSSLGTQSGGEVVVPAAAEDPRKQQDRRWWFNGRRRARFGSGSRGPHPSPPIDPYLELLGPKLWEMWKSTFGIELIGGDVASWVGRIRSIPLAAPDDDDYCVYDSDPGAFNGLPFVGSRISGGRYLVYNPGADIFARDEPLTLITIGRGLSASPPAILAFKFCVPSRGYTPLLGERRPPASAGTRGGVQVGGGWSHDLDFADVETIPTMHTTAYASGLLKIGVGGAYVDSVVTPESDQLADDPDRILFGAGTIGGAWLADFDAAQLMIVRGQLDDSELAAIYALAQAEYDL